MSDPSWRGPFDSLAGQAQTDSKWNKLQEAVASKFIDQIASAPSPSDRLAQKHREAAFAKPPATFDNVGGPNAQSFQSTGFGAFDGSSRIRSFNELTQGQRTGNAQLTTPMQTRPDVPVLHGDPNRRAPEYQGGIGPDAVLTGRIVSAAGPGPRLLWELFTKTYNSRAKENVLPSQLPLSEVAPQARAKIDHWMLMGDSDLSQPRAEYNNRNLRPGPEQKGHVFAVGVNKEGNPVNVLEYYWGDKEMIYYGQYQISYSRDNQGLMHSRIDHYNAKEQTAAPGPRAVIGNSLNVYEGTTEYVSNNQNQVVSMLKFDYINPSVPKVGIDFDQNGAHKVWRDANSGKLMEQAVSGNMVRQTVNSLSPQFYFRNLYGP